MSELHMRKLPGEEYEGTHTIIALEKGQVVLLWSAWGVEGVFTSGTNLQMHWEALTHLSAYQDEMFNYQIMPLDMVYGTDSYYSLR